MVGEFNHQLKEYRLCPTRRVIQMKLEQHGLDDEVSEGRIYMKGRLFNRQSKEYHRSRT